MRLLYLRSSSMQCDPHVSSLKECWNGVGGKAFKVFDYFCEDSDNAILDIAHEFEPTHVIWIGTCGGPYETKAETFQELRKKSKTIMICPEASHPDWDRLIQEFYDKDSFDLIINIDGNPNWGHRQGKGLTTLAMYGQRAYQMDHNYYHWRNRPIDVGFCGGSGYPGTMRQRLVHHLTMVRRHNNMPLLTQFPFIECPGTYQLYADFMRMTKIAVNSCGSGEDRSKHVKGRVVEAGLAGCCLIEEEGSPIGLWFSKESYFTFETPEHCEAIIYEILSDPTEAIKRRDNFCNETRRKYTPYKMWDEIFQFTNHPKSPPPFLDDRSPSSIS